MREVSGNDVRQGAYAYRVPARCPVRLQASSGRLQKNDKVAARTAAKSAT